MKKTDAAIAVVGMACHYPGARSSYELWENILARRRAFRRFLECRMPARDYFSEDPAAPDRTYGQQGAFLDGFAFDRAKWRVPQSSFASTDISHWIALEVAASALKDAGHSGGEGLPRDRTGVILGNTLTGEVTRANTLRLRWPFVARELGRAARETGMGDGAANSLLAAFKERYLAHFPPTDEDTLAGGLSNTIAGRICGAFDFGAGGYVVDGACASSLLAVCTAAAALEERRVDACLAGGVDISMDPFELVGFAKARALSPSDMRVYDRRGNGFIPGEGCAFVVLKRLDDALSAGNKVYAVLRGWGISSDGRNAITAPKVAGQVRAIQRAWEQAGRPDFVEGHGTGTAVGDRVELEAIAEVAAAFDTPEHGIGVTSLKSILGHTKAAAGIGAFCKAVMAVNQRVLPPTAACDEPNPVFFDKARSLFPIRRGEVRPPEQPLRAGVSAMGFGGINAHVVVESHGPPDKALRPALPESALMATEQPAELFVFGADTLEALRVGAKSMQKTAEGIALGEMADLSAELCARLPERPMFRAAVIAETPRALAQGIEQLLSHDTRMGPSVWLHRAAGEPRIGFLCPGQGSQMLEMTRVLLARDSRLKERAAYLAGEAAKAGCEGLLEAIFPALDRVPEPNQQAALKRRLSQTETAQPAIGLATLLWAERLQALGLSPSAAGGHSLGELSAAAIAGAISPETLMRLAAKRGRAMAAPPDRPGKMASLAVGAERAAELIRHAPGYLAIANINGPKQTVVAGDGHAIDALVKLAEQEHIGVRVLSVSNAFHSELVRNAADALRHDQEIPAYSRQPHIPVLSTLVQEELTQSWAFRSHVADHILSPVDFISLARRMAARCDMLIEVGPGRVLSGLLGSILQGERPLCWPVEAGAGQTSDLLAVLAQAYVHGAHVHWPELHAGRLIRPFVAPSDRVFLVNPCEKGEVEESKTQAHTKNTPEPVEMPPVVPEHRPAEPRGHTVGLEALLDLVARRTGFEKAMLSGEQRLQDDLNLDSIKAGELIAEAARLAGIAHRIDPVQYTHHRLQDISTAFTKIAGENGLNTIKYIEKKPSSQAEPSSPHAPGPELGPVWTRMFGLHAQPAQLPRSADGLVGRRIRVLAREPEALIRWLTRAGAQIDDMSPDTLVAVLGAPTENLGACVHELHALVSAAGPGVETILAIQSTDGRLGLGANPRGTSAQAFLRSLYLERPALSVTVLDIAPLVDPSKGIESAVNLLGAIPPVPGFRAWGVDEAGAWTGVAFPLNPTELREIPTCLRPGDVVLVTGGARGITAVCARALARKTGVHLALVGSTPIEKADEEMLHTLGRMTLEGIRAEYIACDIGDREAVFAAVARIRERLGPIAAVIHGAARNTPRRVEQVSEAEALREITPKLAGCLHVMEALESAPPRLFVGLSSIIGVSGMQGNAWYAFANEALDHAIARFSSRHPSCRPVSVAFGVWKDVGMGQKMGSVSVLSRIGIGAIDPEEGARRFLQAVLHDPGVRQPVVAAQMDGMPTWPAALARGEGLRFLDGELRGMPGVACRARHRLDPEKHAYLRDHVFRDTMLMPTVFGLEAMAQVAWSARAIPDDPAILAVEQISLDAPITVGPEGIDIEIRALLREDAPNIVDCEIRTAQTGFSKAHFSATVVFAPSAENGPKAEHFKMPMLSPPSIQLDPKHDLYGGLLFQGPMFHRMERIIAVAERAVVFEGTAYPGETERFLIGDPYFRDVLLQAGQLLVPRDDALPVHIARIEFAGGSRHGARTVLATLDASNESTHLGSVVVVDHEGRRVESLEGYQLRILAHHPEWPALSEILHPEESDERRLKAQIEAACAARGLEPPMVILRHESLHDEARNERHSRMASVLRPSLGSAELRWEQDGAPKLSDGRGISLSHDGGYWLALILKDQAATTIGCDLEAITERKGWPELVQHRALLQALRAGGDDLHTAGTRLWAVREALHKAGAQDHGLTLQHRDGGVVEFSAGVNGRSFRVLSLRFAAARGPRRIVAWAFPRFEAAAEPALIDADSHRIRVISEPHPHMETRFVVSFDESSSLGGRVPIYMLSAWMGKLRELAIAGLQDALIPNMHSGKHGMVTQEAWLEQSGECAALDRMEAATWVEDLRPTTCILRCSFHRLNRGGRDYVGTAAQRFAWVEVVGHGQVRGAPFPPALQAFLQGMHRPREAVASPEPMMLPNGVPWLRERLNTSLVDSNVVGNLYFTNYFRWPHRVIAQFLWEHQRDLILARGKLGEMVYTNMHIEFLREAMPFDAVGIALHAEPMDEKTLNISFIYEREEPDGERTRLAVGRMNGGWMQRTPSGLLAQRLPDVILRHLPPQPTHQKPSGYIEHFSKKVEVSS